MMSTAEFVEKAMQKHGEGRFDYSESYYAGFHNLVKVRCNRHGCFETKGKTHLHTLTGGCSSCLSEAISASARMTNAEFIARAKEIHGDSYCYDEVEYRTTRCRVTIKCKLHGSFQMKACRHLQGRGCRKCTYKSLQNDRRLSFWEFVDAVIATHGAHRYEYELNNHINSSSKISIKCPKHGWFQQSVWSHRRGHGCAACCQSAGEKRTRDTLTQLDIEFLEQARFPDCKAKRALPFDFFVPSNRLLIEFDGAQHYVISEYWGGVAKLEETQKHDEIKNKFAQTHGYHLLRIPYWKIDSVEDLVLDALVSTTLPSNCK